MTPSWLCANHQFYIHRNVHYEKPFYCLQCFCMLIVFLFSFFFFCSVRPAMMTFLPTKLISQSWEDSNISSRIQVVISPAIGCLLRRWVLSNTRQARERGRTKTQMEECCRGGDKHVARNFLSMKSYFSKWRSGRTGRALQYLPCRDKQ